jgi:thiol-disulfide isomerase/thioredoxin
MLERAAIALLVLGAAFGAYAVATRWQVGRVEKGAAGDTLLSGLRPGVPAIIYFWSEACAPCKFAQKPALDQVQGDLGPDGVQIVAVNALEQPDLADGWGVLGLPTTFIVDTYGEPRRVNHGVTGAARLKSQIAELAH